MLMIFFVGAATDITAQSRKERDSLNVTEKAFYELDYKDSKGKEYLLRIERYDTRGELIEEIEYDENSKIKKHLQYVYKDELLLKELSLDSKGNIEKTIEHTYDADGLRISKKYLDAKGRLYREKIYRYKK